MNRKRPSTPRARRLTFENLETRELLSVSPGFVSAEPVETRNAAIYAAIETFEPIKFNLPDEAAPELSNAVQESAKPYQLAQPTITSSSSTTKTITVNWKEIADAVDYDVMYRSSSEKNFATVNNVSGTSFTISDLNPNSSYYVKVVANGDGITTLDSVDKNAKTVKTQALKTLAQPKIDNVQTFTKAIVVHWTELEGATGYEVQYRKSTDKSFTTLAEHSNNTAWFEGLEPGTSYQVKVIAKGDGVTTADSSAKSVKTIKTVALTTLAQPKIATSASTTKAISITWNGVPNSTGYEVLYRKSTDKTFTVCQNVDQIGLKADITNLDPGSSYYVKVVAKGDGEFTKDSSDKSSKTIKTVALKALAQPKISAITSEMRQLDVAWNEVDGAVGYEVQYKKSKDKTYTTYDGEFYGASVTITGLDANSTYSVRVIAKGDYETTKDSAAKAAKSIKTKPLLTLAKPTITSSQTTESSITINWSPVENAKSYTIYSKKGGKTETFVVEPSATQYTIANLAKGSKYSVRVVANGDKVTTADSPSSTTTNITTSKVLKAASPAIISGAATTNALTFAWNPVANAARYEISYIPMDGKVPNVVSTSHDENAYTITGLESDRSYYVQVRAIGENGYVNSDYCEHALFRTLPQEKLNAPSNVYFSIGANSVDLIWDAVEGATSYSIRYGVEGDSAIALVELPAERTSYRAAGLISGAEYVFQVRANGEPGVTLDSEFSREYEITTKALAQVETPNVVVAKRALSSITLSWEPCQNAAGYAVSYVSFEDETLKTTNLSAEATEFTLSDLPQAASYTFMVVALGNEFDVSDSNPVILNASTTTLLDTPAVASELELDLTTLSWEPIANATGYSIVYGVTGSEEMEEVKVSSEETSHTFVGLEQATSYTFQVFATNESPDFETSTPCLVTTFTVGVLETPSLTYELGEDFILLKWEPVAHAQGYALECGRLATEDVDSYRLSKDATEFKVPRVSNPQDYVFRISAIGDDEIFIDSPFSSDVSVSDGN